MFSKLAQGHWPIFLLSSLSAFANLYLPIFLARILTPAQMGEYKIFFLYLGALPFLFLAGGPINSVYYYVGRDEQKRKPYFQQAYLLALGLSALMLVAGLPLRDHIVQWISLPKDHVTYMLVGAFLSVPASYYAQAKTAMGSTVKGSLYDAIFEFGKVIVFIVAAYLTSDVSTIFAGFCAVFAVKFALSIALKKREGLIAFPFEKDKIKEIFSYCLPISLAGLVTFFTDKVDQFILAGVLPTDEFAFYSMGCLIIPPLYLLEMSIAKVLVPRLAESGEGSPKKSLIHYRRAVADSAYLLVPAFFGLFLFATPITELLYTEKFISSAGFLKAFAFSYLFLIIPYDAVPRATGKTSWIFKLTLGIGLLSLGGALLASKHYGAMETLYVALAFKLISRFAGLVYSSKIMGWNILNTMPLKKLGKFLGLSLALSAGCLAVKDQFATEMNWFLVCSPVFALIYLGTFAPWKLRSKNAV